MTTRTSSRTVTFPQPFTIGGLDEVLVAGQYRIDTDEELVVGLSRPVYRRILTLIELPPTSQHPNRRQLLEISPDDLEIASARDKARLFLAMGVKNVTHDKPPSHPLLNSEPQPPSEQVTPIANPVDDDKPPAPPARSIFGMAAELKKPDPHGPH